MSSPPRRGDQQQNGLQPAEDDGDQLERVAPQRVRRAPGSAASGGQQPRRALSVAAAADQVEEALLEVARRRAPRRRCRRRAPARRRRSRRGRTCAAPGPSSGSTRRPCRRRATKPVQDVADVRRRHRVDRLERLVEHQQARRVHQRRGERDLLRHAGGVVGDDRAGRALEVEQAQQVGDALGDDVAVEPEQQAREGDELLAGEPVVEVDAVGEVADQPLRLERVAATRRCRARAATPASGRSRPVAIDSVVVLPAPFGPTRP